MIILKNISKNYNSQTVLKNVSIEINSGEIYGLLGPSGSGKTTLINIMIGKIKDFSGSLSILGYTNKTICSHDFKGRVGIMTDSSAAYSKLTVKQNLEFFASLYHVSHSKIKPLLQSVYLFEDKDKLFKDLSKGMKQRVLLAKALLHNPEFLILDEPTSALDPKYSKKIHSLLYELKSNGTTIFLTTHDMEEAEKLCNKVSILHNGNIKLQGDPKKFLVREKEYVFETFKNKHIIKGCDNLSAQIAKILENEEIKDISVKTRSLRDNFLTITTQKE
ncbi:ABC transporter ATP-binding protein [Staphylococcus equorum]